MENPIQNEGSKKKYLMAIVLMVLAIAGASAYILLRPEAVDNGADNDSDDNRNLPEATVIIVTPTPTLAPVSSGAPSPTTTVSEAKTFTVIGSNYSFSLKEIKVKKGDKVRIVFQNSNGMHDWVIDEFNTRTKKLQSGQSETVEFTADKAGTFQYYCSVGSHRANGMWGNLIVE